MNPKKRKVLDFFVEVKQRTSGMSLWNALINKKWRLFSAVTDSPGGITLWIIYFCGKTHLHTNTDTQAHRNRHTQTHRQTDSQKHIYRGTHWRTQAQKHRHTLTHNYCQYVPPKTDLYSTFLSNFAKCSFSYARVNLKVFFYCLFFSPKMCLI